MKIGIICAGDREIAPFWPHIEEERVSMCAKLRVHEGKISGVSVAVVQSGVCKVNAAIAAMTLIQRYGVTAILNGGTAGGMAVEVGLMDTVVMTKCAHHDVSKEILTQSHPCKDEIWFRSDEKLLGIAKETLAGDKNIYFGRMVSGEQFITHEGREKINRDFAPLCVDMETAAIAQVCEACGVPFLAIRSITDTAQHAGAENFERNVVEASKLSKIAVMRLLERIQA